MSDIEYTHTGYEYFCSQREAIDENKLHLAVEDFSNMYEQALIVSIQISAPYR